MRYVSVCACASGNEVYLQMAILMEKMMIIGWSWRYPISKQTHLSTRRGVVGIAPCQRLQLSASDVAMLMRPL